MNRTINRYAVIAAMENAGIDTENLREDYSGRSMYGDVAFGFTVDRLNDAFRFFAALGADASTSEAEGSDEMPDVADSYDLARGACSDSMGLDTIMYFPGWKLTS